jgi:hypothetical protein
MTRPRYAHPHEAPARPGARERIPAIVPATEA